MLSDALIRTRFGIWTQVPTLTGDFLLRVRRWSGGLYVTKQMRDCCNQLLDGASDMKKHANVY